MKEYHPPYTIDDQCSIPIASQSPPKHPLKRANKLYLVIMASSAGWVRVASGLRLVASAAASQSAKEANTLAVRVAQHGVDLATSARSVAAATDMVQRMPDGRDWQVEPQQKSPNGSQNDSATGNSKLETTTDILHNFQGTNEIKSESQDESQKQLKSESYKIEVDGSNHDRNTLVHAASKHHKEETERYERLKEGRAVPATRLSRAFGFASLGVGLAAGTVAGVASRLVGGASSEGSSSQSVVATDANADRLAASLCRMRGAALKLGQMLSIQDESLLPPALSRALKQVRQGADAMPKHQLLTQIESQLGSQWKELLHSFDEVPFAAASIGQVHRATVSNGDTTKRVVMKVQYPGVADSIESDLNNLSMLVTMTGLAPPGLFIEEVIRVGRNELKVECDYMNEMENQRKFKHLVESDPVLSRERFAVPDVIEELTTSHILTSEFAPGGTIDKVSNLDQEERNRIGRSIMRLTILELFVWRFMQTDPNWGNFLYDIGTRTTHLIDFGAAREYSKSFVDGYLRIVWAAANKDGDTIMDQSHKMGFLTGEENDIMLEAHKMSGFTVGEPFQTDGEFDFRGSNISTRLSQHSSAFLQHRLTPPPEEVYTLHRKLAGAYMLCIKLGAVINCRSLLEEVVVNHIFEDSKPSPITGLEKSSS